MFLHVRKQKQKYLNLEKLKTSYKLPDYDKILVLLCYNKL